MTQKITYFNIFLISLIFLLVSCNKRKELRDGVNANDVNFAITQPSIASASFVAQCTNYRVRIDSVIFLDPNSLLYYQDMNGNTYEKNEEFMIGGYTSANGVWIIQFRGKRLDIFESFDVSIPFSMIIEEGDEDEK